ncbi:MAG: hypothetical protein M3394_02340 [Actinomycetota bacterium]|nr:hypothetical protein [Actinomycetota bacterium]
MSSTEIGRELRNRGRDTIRISQLELHREPDPELLQALVERIDVPWVLVTADDQMPGEHAGLITTHGLTMATVDGRRPPDQDEAQWQRDTVHRWAHAMQEQAEGALRRYSPRSNRRWTQRRF